MKQDTGKQDTGKIILNHEVLTRNMDFINLSDSYLNANLDKHGLRKLIILPDYSPGKGKLPVGSVAVYYEDMHIPSAEFLGPDIGCGMALAKFDPDVKDIEYLTYKIKAHLEDVKTELGSLGRGNHFINFYSVRSSEVPELNKNDTVVLVHSGSRYKGIKVFENGLRGRKYLEEYQDAVEYGKQNRSKILEIIQNCSNTNLTLLLDLPHNTIEATISDYIYRKGAVKLKQGEIGIIPSAMGGDAVLIRGNDAIVELENSMCHGTGRKISRRIAKGMEFDSSELRKRICIPNDISDEQIKTEAPHCYRTLDEVLPKLEKYVSVVSRLEALSFYG